MPLKPRHRQELIAIVSLLAGVFIGLTLLPWDVTGPAGRVVGTLLWRLLGAGAALIPVLGLVIALASFGRFRELELRRASALVAGLVILLPFVIAIFAGIRETEDLPASYYQWTNVQRAVGVIPAMSVVMLTSLVGTAGTVILGLIALSSLTIYTLDWHPFRKLAAGSKKPGRQDDVLSPSPPSPSQASFEPETRPRPGLLQKLTKRPPRPEASLDDLPPLDLLRGGQGTATSDEEEQLEQVGGVLVDTLGTFKVEGKIVGRTTGPVVTQYEVKPAPGVKVGRIAALADDLALAMRAKSIRIVAPIPGKAAVGV